MRESTTSERDHCHKCLFDRDAARQHERLCGANIDPEDRRMITMTFGVSCSFQEQDKDISYDTFEYYYLCPRLEMDPDADGALCMTVTFRKQDRHTVMSKLEQAAEIVMNGAKAFFEKAFQQTSNVNESDVKLQALYMDSATEADVAMKIKNLFKGN